MPMYACDPERDPRVVAIVGAGAAAAAAAEALRQLFFIGRIVMISPEEHWPYDRPNLSKDFLAGELEAKWLPLRSPEFYERARHRAPTDGPRARARRRHAARSSSATGPR